MAPQRPGRERASRPEGPGRRRRCGRLGLRCPLPSKWAVAEKRLKLVSVVKIYSQE